MIIIMERFFTLCLGAFVATGLFRLRNNDSSFTHTKWKRTKVINPTGYMSNPLSMSPDEEDENE
jgi:hypothetical protein